MLIRIIVLAVFVQFIASDSLPTNYEYYTSEGIDSGLSADQSYFLLNGKNITIFSGSIHYFRVPRAYWRDRLRKLRAAGFNTVETYVAWNLHEPYSGVYDFGDGGSEMEDFLHLEEYLQIAQEEDLFVIIRNGPYICSEYKFGGFPSWLLRDREVGYRTNETTYMKYVKRYFDVLLPIEEKYQFTKGGPIIAVQVENEYGYFNNLVLDHLKDLRQIILDNGIKELLITSDGPTHCGNRGNIPEYFLLTGNFGAAISRELNDLNNLHPGRPMMVMEYWIGWFDNWGTNHHTKRANQARTELIAILSFPSSINIYMFHGGTNFAFCSGAGVTNKLLDNSGFSPVATNYDYDAPLTEAGDYTDKYYLLKDLLVEYNPIKTANPEVPELISRVAYPNITIEKQLLFSDIIDKNAPLVLESENVMAMEFLDINGGSGQSSGYIVYRKENVDLEANTTLKIEGHVCDTVFVLVDGELVSPVLESSDDINNFGYWRLKDSTLVLNSEPKKGATVDLVVEEWSRLTGGTGEQFANTLKGLWQGDVYLNDEKISNWKIIPLEFKKEWINNLKGWSDKTSSGGGSLNLAVLELSEEPVDTYIDMSNWSKGLVVVNGFTLGKYALIGPQQALYLPAPFLKKGTNNIIIFEHFRAANELVFSANQIWRTK